jgi:hypothetical protein
MILLTNKSLCHFHYHYTLIPMRIISNRTVVLYTGGISPIIEKSRRKSQRGTIPTDM